MIWHEYLARGIDLESISLAIFFVTVIFRLLPLPCLRLVQETDVAAYFQLAVFQPNRAFIVLAVLGIVDATAFPLLLLL